MGGRGVVEDVTSFTTEHISRVVRNMIGQSQYAAWFMLSRIPRQEIRLINPMPMYAHLQGGKLCDSSSNINLGLENIGQKRNIYNRNGMLPKESLTEAKWPGFMRTVVHLMPDNRIDRLDN
eukprot:4667565-Karenia_brevis.AAC.1